MNDLKIKKIEKLEWDQYDHYFFGSGYIDKSGTFNYKLNTNCREVFFNDLLDHAHYKLLCCNYNKNNNKALKMAKFIKKAERILKLKRKTKISCLKGLTVFKISDFWNRSQFRFGILTVLMKIGYSFKGDNFWKIINSNEYTGIYQGGVYFREALNLFFKGFTKIRIKNSAEYGFDDLYNIVDVCKDVESVKRILIKPQVH
jgi:hypothetical protein